MKIKFNYELMAEISCVDASNFVWNNMEVQGFHLQFLSLIYSFSFLLMGTATKVVVKILNLRNFKLLRIFKVESNFIST